MYGRPIYFGAVERLVATVLGCIGGAALLLRVNGGWWRSSLVWLAVLQIPLLFAAPLIYDRYLLPLLPGACWLALGQGFGRAGPATQLEGHATSTERWTWLWRLLAVATLAAYACLSIALVHDCLSWNRARWTLARRALANRIPAQAIEGGFEWDGWYSLDTSQQSSQPATSGLPLQYTRRNFPAVTGQHALSFHVLPATVVEDSEKCELWLRPGGWLDRREYSVHLLKPKW
jgi:hypothetical protein